MMNQNHGSGLEGNCDYCSQKRAEIFQVTGDYCLQCWQEMIQTAIQIRNPAKRITLLIAKVKEKVCNW